MAKKIQKQQTSSRKNRTGPARFYINEAARVLPEEPLTGKSVSGFSAVPETTLETTARPNDPGPSLTPLTSSPGIAKKELPWGTLGTMVGITAGLIMLPVFFPFQNFISDGNSASLLVVFLTGLTTGGLSCMAVQGGLLAASITPKEKILTGGKAKDSSSARPIAAFIGAKLVAYLILGALLGMLGSILSLSPTMQAFINLSAGLFMLATAFNLLNVHPIFRYVSLQPPRSAMRFMRRYSKSEALFAPIVLGFLTVLIPCGTTIAMEALSISSGSPLTGSLIMGAFVLGTSPLFFVLGYFATQLGAALHSGFRKVAAIAIIVLSIISINTALNLLDAPVTLNTIASSIFDSGQVSTDNSQNLLDTAATAPAAGAGAFSSSAPLQSTNSQAQDGINQASGSQGSQEGVQQVSIRVSNEAYSPGRIQVKSGQPIRITLLTEKTTGCTRGFFVPSLNIQKVLPVTGQTVINLPAQKPGVIRFVCSMGMYSGTITVI